jgi:hypothetical protein
MADSTILTEQDRQQIRENGLTDDHVHAQVDLLRRGFAATNLDRPCILGDGIRQFSTLDSNRYERIFRVAVGKGRICKFVPASGAGTRMFQALLSIQKACPRLTRAYLESKASLEPEALEVLHFFEELPNLAVYRALEGTMGAPALEVARSGGNYYLIADVLLSPDQLNYPERPKGLLPFHDYGDHFRTPVEEHLAEAAAYAQDSSGRVRLHFTIARENQEIFEDHINGAIQSYECGHQLFDVTCSSQKRSTDTIALSESNELIRENDDRILFRASGHGALLENLNEIDCDIVLIKNIDNVSVSDRLDEISRYKRILGGLLIETQLRIFGFLELLEHAEGDEPFVTEARLFVTDVLGLAIPGSVEDAAKDRLTEFLIRTLNRPIRVCGMVKNTGEPGGGPFWVRQENGAVTPQIIESAQVDFQDPNQRRVWSQSTHFNPVDLACGVLDYKGTPFHLPDFVDPDTGFIVKKSWRGQTINAMELPGLWNGSMSRWITIFAEVPMATFSPVKRIEDLLKPAHRTHSEHSTQL